MARVIKGGGAGQQPRRQIAKLRGSGGKKVIEKEVYRAQQEGAEILERAEKEKSALLEKAKQQAAQAREEAQAEGAQEAFEEAAAEALEAFRRRATRYDDAADDIRILALEVVRKILGGKLSLRPQQIEHVLVGGMAELRARRKLRVQVPTVRQKLLQRERPRLMARLEQEPDLVIEAAADVSAGRARIVTEPGGALCSEQVALDTLAEALGVDEQAVAPAPQSAVVVIPAAALAGLAEQPADDGVVWEGNGADSDEAESTDFLPARPREPVSNTVQVAKPALDNQHRVSTDRTARPRPSAERTRRSRASGERPASSGSKSRSASREESQTGGAARQKVSEKKRRAAADGERTMALEVSSLRSDLAEIPSDELDLFADDVVSD